MKGNIKMRVPYKSLCAFVILLFAASSFALAQGIAAGSGEAAGTFGYAHVAGVTSYNHFPFGGSGSYNINQGTAVGFEYKYIPLGSLTASGVTVSGKIQTYGGVARFSFSDSAVAPFVAVGFGGLSESAAASESGAKVSVSQSGYYYAFGGGASIFCGPRWGIRPEFRYEREQLLATTVSGTSIGASGQNNVQFLASVFYQFGGRQSQKK
jgi:hypothetical protein